MTEGEWLACGEPVLMLGRVRQGPCDRKLRLFAAARGRRAGRLDAEGLRVLDAAERLADGLCSARDFVAAWRDAAGPGRLELTGVGRHATRDAAYCLDGPLGMSRSGGAADAALLRELFGPLPFRRVPVDPAWLAWQGGTVGRLARCIYEEHRFGDLPVLADALEDAGCTDPDLLGHLRTRGGHVRGCWAADLLLGHRAGAARVSAAGRGTDEVVAECVAAGSAVLTQAGGRLEDLLTHPSLGRVGRLEIDFGDLLESRPTEAEEEADSQALESIGDLSPLRAIALPDDGAERLIRLLASLPDAGGLETLTLYWNYWNPALPDARRMLLRREAEVNRLVGKDVCLVEPVEHC